MSDEIKVKKENVLKVHKESGTKHTQWILEGLFPEAFEEEKKESELDRLIYTIADTNMKYRQLDDLLKKYKQQIIDLAKKKISGCGYFDNERYYFERAKQKLEEM